ncbi:MAG: hypothetical protein ACFFEA_00520 [Candidatus Thorarchaeota archaeon]
MDYSNDNEEEPVEAPEDEESIPPGKGRPRRSGWSGTRRKSNASAATFVVWVAFATIWLFFFAGTGYTFWENVAVLGASFLFIGLVNALMWAPSQWRIRLSIIVGIGWLIFIVLWWPFYAAYYSGYQNFAAMLLSVGFLIALTGGPWMTQIPREAFMAFRGRAALGLVTLFAYLAFLILWLWFYAAGYDLYFNITIGLVATLVMYIVAIGVSVTEADMEPLPRWLGPGIGFVWLVLLIVWFYFFASGFNDYQNFAVVVLSIILMAVIGGLIGRSRWGGIDSFDWRD